MGNEVILLDSWASPFGMRARIALAEHGVTYEYRNEKLINKGEFLLRMNPIHKKVPVLVHNDNPVCESLIIVQYIDEVWKTNVSLLPFDPYRRAEARFWADFIDKKICESARRIWTTKGADQEKGKKDFIGHLTVLEQQLGDKPYFGGDAFGFVDVAFIPFYTWFSVYETAGNFKIEESCPKIIEWAKRCLQRESVKALPDQNKVYEFYLELKKVLGME